jgi:hypothetical protein
MGYQQLHPLPSNDAIQVPKSSPPFFLSLFSFFFLLSFRFLLLSRSSSLFYPRVRLSHQAMLIIDCDASPPFSPFSPGWTRTSQACAKNMRQGMS